MDCNYHALKNKRDLGFTCYTLIKPGQLQVPFPAKKCLKKEVYITNLNAGKQTLNTEQCCTPQYSLACYKEFPLQQFELIRHTEINK